MLGVIRYSQLVGLVTIDSATAAHLGTIEEAWIDDSGRIVYLSSPEGYLPLDQVAAVSTKAVSTYGNLTVSPARPIRRLYQLTVKSTQSEPLGWIEDFLFDWHTGAIAAYILAGEIAKPFGGRAVILPRDIQELTAEAIILTERTPDHLRREASELKGFLSEQRHPVRQLVHELGEHLRDLISPQDQPEVVRVKIKTIGDEMAASGHLDHQALSEAIEFLQDQWEHVQRYLHRASHRAQTALASAWQHFTDRPL